MGRRIASQVHHQVSRLMRGNFIQKEPKWYQPVLNFPPLPLPAKAPPVRTSYDQRMKPQFGRQAKLRRPKNRPMPIHYIEDDIRRQFYADHPFEAFRPATLIEKGDIQLHEVNGASWTRLRQRGRNPQPEDAIQFAVNLHQIHDIPLSQAYAQAIAQFRSLRSEHHISTTFAVMEAEDLGAVFVHGEIEHAFEKEKRALSTWEKLADVDEGSLAARKRWKMIAERHIGETDWSRGVQYVKMWQAGNRVNYSPALTRPIEENGEMGMEDDEDYEEEDEDEEYDDEGVASRSSYDVEEDDIGESEEEDYEEEGEEEEEGSSDLLTVEELEDLLEEQILGVDDLEDGEGEESEWEERGEEEGDWEEGGKEDEWEGEEFEEETEVVPAPEGKGSEFFDFTKK
ncbi:mitochondrial ribosomal protein S25-domain-containing protein [Mycena alexandri]|uniref:Small ribosomal subunit protein mS23 n=1 Tax=Mycena alexandri TaxID=1745969 RepID=A0AAD6T7B1_9AGAR|nr:mitochondrial ribosomal protein S25-domain-containing protein [Mycena alexandri]